jgi:Mce-associated membrane protein
VAGIGRPSTSAPAATEPAEAPEVESEPLTSYTAPAWTPPTKPTEPDEPTEVADIEPVPAAAPAETEPDEIEAPEPDTVIEDEAPPPRARPSGKRRAVGSTQPANLAAAEAETRDRDAEYEVRPTNPTLVKAITLGIALLILVALAFWFRGESNNRTEGADADNQALIDTARTSEVAGQVAEAIEKSLSYNYTDLDSTAKAVQDNLTGRALCEYDQLFGQVKKLAPEQKLVLTTRVRDKGVTRLEGDRAEVLVFVDQTTTRADQNQTTASGAQFAVRAEKQGDRWKITQFDMLGQPLPNGQALPSC